MNQLARFGLYLGSRELGWLSSSLGSESALCPVALPLCSLKMYTLLGSLGISEHPVARGTFSPTLEKKLAATPMRVLEYRENVYAPGHSLTRAELTKDYS